MKLYAIRMDPNWDSDYVGVARTLEEVADIIAEFITDWDGYWFNKEALVKHMKTRENVGYDYLIDNFDAVENGILPLKGETYGFMVQAVYLKD